MRCFTAPLVAVTAGALSLGVAFAQPREAVIPAVSPAAVPAVPADPAVSPSDVPHSSASFTIDGVLDDDIWAEALMIELLIETNPRENMPAPVETRAYIVENGSTLLVAFDAKDPNPGNIRAYLRDRDSAYDDDYVGIVVDTFNDARRGFEFFVNPFGVQMDLTQDDVERSEDDSWDAIWDSAGRINGDGFAVEMAIPFSQLRFQRAAGEQTWGIDVLRFYPRENRLRLSNNSRDRGRNCYLCQFAKIRGFANAEPGKDLEIVPSLTASRTDQRDPDTGALAQGDGDEELGMTVSWGITPDVTANLALNPDFSQVEADVPQLDVNNQFSLFFPETRPFFLEGIGYFSTPIEAVFTRTVADPDVGAKLTGRNDDNAYAVFLADDAVTNLLFPGALTSSTEVLDQSNRAFVGRYNRGFGNASTLGALVTQRSGDDYRNDVAGIDGRFRISDRHSVRFQYLDSETEYPNAVVTAFDQPEGSFGGEAARIEYDFSSRQWWGDWSFQSIDPGFRADSGFVTQVDIEQHNGGLGRIWHGDGDEWWNQLRVGMSLEHTEDSAGQLLGRRVQSFFSFNGPLQSYFEIGMNRRQQFWEGVLYDGEEMFMYGQVRPRGGLNLSLSVNRGDQVDFANSRLGKQLRVEPTVNWNVNRHLLLRLRHSSLQLDNRQGENVFDAELTDLRLTWQFNVRSFLRFTGQRREVKRNVALFVRSDTQSETLSLGSQLLYSYKLNPQTVFFLGYADNHFDDDDFDGLTRLDRSVFIKLAYAWVP